jgi:hypothetical protein
MALTQSIPTAHFRVLLDDTGILQHCNGVVPDRRHGYCLDDVARAIIVMRALERIGDSNWTTPLVRCASFVDAAIEGPMIAHNFMSFDRTWCEEASEGDHVGRAIWALGELSVGDHPLAGWAVDRARAVIDHDRLLHAALMTRVFALLGLSRLGATNPQLHTMIRDACSFICSDIDLASSWPWPEPRVRYDAGRVPQALIECGALLSISEVVDCGLRLLAWLDEITMSNGSPIRYVGHLGLGPHDRLEDSGDEQPVEVAALAAAHLAAYRVTRDAAHRSRVRRGLDWFHGVNRLGVPMVDLDTGAGHDGLGATERNVNTGAESTIAYLMTALAVAQADRDE